MMQRRDVGEAILAFRRWVDEHDPDGNMDVLDQAIAYTEWANKSSIERYLDAAQPINPSA